MATTPARQVDRTVRAPSKYIAEDIFIYEVNFLAVAPGAAPTSTLFIEADSDFELIKLCQMTDIAGAAQTEGTRIIPNADILIQVAGSGRQLSNVAVPIGNIFGFGDLPFILPSPRIFPSQSTLTFTFTSREAAITVNTRLALIGRKKFKAT
jgi:hypothetical protein